MFESFHQLIKILTDKAISWTTKIATTIIVIFVIWTINNSLNFIDSFNTNNKLNQLEKISIVLKDSTLTVQQKKILIDTRVKIFNHKSALEYICDFISSLPEKIHFPISTNKNKEIVKTVNPINSVNNSVNIKNPILQFIFSNIFLLLFQIALPFILFISDKSKFHKNAIAASIFSIILLSGVAFLISFIFDFIPLILNRPWINYSLDFIIQSTIWILAIYFSAKAKKHKT